MKTRFSILTLLGVTAYVALTVAAITHPVAWRTVWLLAWLVQIAHLLTHAMDSSRPVSAACGRVAIGCVFVYLTIPKTVLELSFPEYWLTYLLVSGDTNAYIVTQPVLHFSMALVFGWTGYFMMHWRLARRHRCEVRPNDA
jgi:hypothetical protein